MARWRGDARGRLERAALASFSARGYDRTTVAEIAERAGLTERSFYRYFPDKREVLFGGGNELESHLVTHIAAAGAEELPLTVLLAAFATIEAVLRPREFLVERAAVIAANPPLHERELIKLASIAAALVNALVGRGTDPRTARLVTGMGMSVLSAATAAWVDSEERSFVDQLHDVTEDIRLLARQVAT